MRIFSQCICSALSSLRSGCESKSLMNPSHDRWTQRNIVPPSSAAVCVFTHSHSHTHTHTHTHTPAAHTTDFASPNIYSHYLPSLWRAGSIHEVRRLLSPLPWWRLSKCMAWSADLINKWKPPAPPPSSRYIYTFIHVHLGYFATVTAGSSRPVRKNHWTMWWVNSFFSSFFIIFIITLKMLFLYI